MNKPLLTIAVPTYNRAQLLDLCLSRIVDQAQRSPDKIEIIVSNNASTDNTRNIALKNLGTYQDFRYYENEKNFGADYNFAQCFKQAQGDYVWIFSDDDILLPRALERITPLLKSKTLGIVTLEPNFYKHTIDESAYPYSPMSFKLLKDPLELAQERHFWLTYITGVIVNKRIALQRDIHLPREDSFLIQLGWVLPALFSTYPSAKVETPLILGRALDVLVFKPFYVFGVSYPSVLNELSKKGVLPVDAKEKLIELIITRYFTFYIQTGCHISHGERPLLILAKSFWNRKAFWSHLFPLFMKRYLHKSISWMSPSIRVKRFISRLTFYRSK